MNFMNFLNGFAGMGGTAEGVTGANAGQANPWSVAAQGQQSSSNPWAGGLTQPQQMPIYDPLQDPEFGTVGVPPSLREAMARDQQQQGMVLTDKGSIPAPELYGGAQSYPVGGTMPPAQGFQPAGQASGGQPHQAGFGDIFNPMSSYDMNPSNTQGFEPNMFLRLSQGYEQGGLVGALGMLLTDYYNSANPPQQ